jgi:hypothetical protein
VKTINNLPSAPMVFRGGRKQGRDMPCSIKEQEASLLEPLKREKGVSDSD